MPLFILPLVPITIALVYLSRFYTRGARDIKRLGHMPVGTLIDWP